MVIHRAIHLFWEHNVMFGKKALSRFSLSAKTLLAVCSALLTLGTVHSVSAINLAQSPLFLAQPVRPIMMLNMSNDHQLFFKAYDDYSDLDGDGYADTTYDNDLSYYGYFDENKCYKHTGGAFRPTGNTGDHYCSGNNWSGNFLNWSTMTRMDTVRKILYGGKRSTDEAGSTILERAMLTQDAHSFAKYYNGSDLSSLTPYSVPTGDDSIAASGITICNTTDPSNRDQQSQDVNSPPLMQVAKGNYSLWASNEGWQCRWGNGSNDNESSLSGINAYSDSPKKSSARLDDLIVRVEVCNPNHMDEENNEGCLAYAGGGLKPIGLLQEYGEDDKVYFGLITGSYGKNKSGGVLRKNASSITDEINTNGTFKLPANGLGIVGTLDAIRISRYSFSSGQYNSTDNCPWEMASFGDGSCSNWGNPQSEMYLESLRYLAGKNANFSVNDNNYIDGLVSVDWQDPIDEAVNYCAPLSVLQFNASTSSYDSDQLGGFSDIAGGKTLDALTNIVGGNESIHGNQFYVGESGSNNDQLCTAKTISSLSNVKGTCPDAPRLGGSYQIAGLAYHARLNGISENREPVQTFGVALAPAVPRVDIPVPGVAGKTVSIQPACRNTTPTPDANCAIVDFKVIAQDHEGEVYDGQLYVNWEDSEQGGDFDQDMWGVVNYRVTATEVDVTTQVIAQSTPNSMGFGYVISGTTQDGFHVHSGINHFSYDNPINSALSCSSSGSNQCHCRDSYKGRCTSSYASATTQTFDIGTSTAKPLEQPLYYAAKWGGFPKEDEDGNELTGPSAGYPDKSYFYATDPGELVESLRGAFDTFVSGLGSASAVAAANSTQLGTDTMTFQASFNTLGWTGDLKAIPITDSGFGAVSWSAAQMMPEANNRNLWTYNDYDEQGVAYEWDNLSDSQKGALNSDDNFGEERASWAAGAAVAGLRERDSLLGDIVNSSPKFAGTTDSGFGMNIFGGSGQGSYNTFVAGKDSETVFVGANDGMLHAFNASNGAEEFAYIPSSVYEQLEVMSDKAYGGSLNGHQYSVDGQLFVGDAYLGGTNGGWRTILVGTLGAGGKGLFALDVTDPADFDAGDILFELNEGNAPEIGNIIGTPIIAPMADGSWAVITGNGYNSSDRKSRLVVIPLDGTYTPTYIETGVGGDNGLSEPSIKTGGGFLARSAYAGDLAGNMYKFDLVNNTLDYVLFEAKDSGGNAQPITAAPVLGLNPVINSIAPPTMVYFGTGRYLTESDLGSTSEQSFYGIADEDPGTSPSGALVGRDELFPKEITSETLTARQVEEGEGDNDDEIDWDTYNGWLLDFKTVAGERVDSKPILTFDQVIFPTVIPSESPCDFGGSSWLMRLTGVGDGPFDPPGDVCEGGDCFEGERQDTLTELTGPNPPPPPPPCQGDDCEPPTGPCDGEPYIIKQNTDGSTEIACQEDPSIVKGRQSWRQIQ
jgi:type IV pilus assembly protein PilY1